MADNFLYYGDNLDVLSRHVAAESVDLVYLDPPFNSNQSYNVLFAEKSGEASAAQIHAFEDTWHWHQATARTYDIIVLAGGKASPRPYQAVNGATPSHTPIDAVPHGARASRGSLAGSP